MLNSLTIERFKCFKRLYVPFKPLTLIAGTNGAGKSSIIQSLLMLRQSCLDKHHDWNNTLVINGDLVDLDDASSLLYADSPSQETEILIELSYGEDDEEVSFNLVPKQSGEVASCSTSGNLDNARNQCPLFDKDFVYLYADREQPRGRYEKGGYSRTNSRLGNRKGNNAAFFMASEINANKDITITELKNQNAKNISVLRNVSAWINEIMGGQVNVIAKETEIDREARFEYSVPNKDGVEQVLSPLNMPFGHSYILPIILAVLTAPPGSMIVIENPESHLHPAAQRKMGEFLARAAGLGVQVLIETHSDHLMNGVRIACHKGLIKSEDVEIDLIGLDKDGRTHVRKHVELDEKGCVVKWVPGFFDEWENALRTLLD